MKWVGTAALVACVPFLLFTPWLFGPLAAGVNGLHFSLLGGSSSSPTIASFGVLSVGLILVAAAAFHLERPKLAAAAGAGLLIVALLALLKFSISDPVLLTRLANETDWTQALHPFLNKYFPNTFRKEPGLWNELSFDTLFDRLYSGWYFLALTWYLLPLVAVSILASAVPMIDRRGRLRIIPAPSARWHVSS